MCADRFMRSIHPGTLEQKRRLRLFYRQKVVGERDRKTNKTRQSLLTDLKPSENKDKTELNFRPSSFQRNHTPFDDDLDLHDEAGFHERNTPDVQQSYTKDPVIESYENACKLYNILPLTYIENGLLQQSFTCKSFQLQDNDCKAMCCALLNNRYVEILDFQENGMGKGPANYFADVIQQSTFLTQIKLVDNNLKSEGAKVICKAVSTNPMIVCLDLSGNSLVERDGIYLRRLIQDSDTLRELFLAKNQLMDVGVRHIVEGLKRTTTLNVLDLSWNYIRLKGASAICKALENNQSLRRVNLAWNGLHKNGAKRLALALKKNKMLTELDITCNRLTEYCIAEILDGLRGNTTLQTLRIGLNHVSPKAAITILQSIYDNKSSGLKLVDLGSQVVYDTFVELYKDLQNERDITVLYGIVWNSERGSFAERSAHDKEMVLLTYDPRTVLMECMRLQSMRLVDFFKWLDVDNNNQICIDELCEGMVKVGIPFRRQTLLGLLRKLDLDNNNLLDFKEMTAAYNAHREHIRKVLAENVNLEFEQTEIGKVSSIMRKLMDRNTALKRADFTSRTRRRKSSFFSNLLSVKRDVTLPVIKNKKYTQNVLHEIPELAADSIASVDASSDEEKTFDTPSKQSTDVANSKNTEMSRDTNTSHIGAKIGSHVSSLSSVKISGSCLASSASSYGIGGSSTMASNTLSIEYSAIEDATESKPIICRSISTLNAGQLQKKSVKLPELITKQVAPGVWDSTWRHQ